MTAFQQLNQFGLTMMEQWIAIKVGSGAGILPDGILSLERPGAVLSRIQTVR